MATRDLHDCDTATAVITFVRARRRSAMHAEADLLASAVTWAAMHSVDTLDDAAAIVVPGCEGELAIAGPSAPLVAEFSVMEFACALGLSTDAGRIYLGEAIELAHRLPKTYARVQSLDLPVWKARRIAKATIDLPSDGASHVDTHLAPVAHSIGVAQLDRTIEEARLRFDPVEAEARRVAAFDARRFDIDARQVSFDGCVDVHGTLDLADALDLEDAVARGAHQLLDLDLPLNVRRSLAVGDLARRQLSLDLDSSSDPAKVKPRQVVLHVHLADAAIARIDNTRSMVSVEQVRSWCTNGDTQVIIKPIIDLTDHVHVDAYEVPDRLKERQRLLQHSCVFPWCTRPAGRCDCDHVEAAARGGPTCDCNVAPLCRRHHRTKTHTRWDYDKVDDTTFIWRSPNGLVMKRDHRGTTEITSPQP
jgi:hypothetical protein